MVRNQARAVRVGSRARRAAARLAVVSVSGTIAAIVLAPAAEAAQWNSINGSVDSANVYYESSVDRHVTTPNDTIKIQLSSFPTSGMSWFCSRASDGTAFSGYTSITTTSTYTLATGIQSGTVFHNNFKGRYNTGSFAGQQYY